jgi:ubiquitin-protein ligase
MVRLAQELSTLTTALPSEHTNAIYVRVEKSRMDMVKALICGAANTPYAHGCFEYDIFCGSNYPSGPPQMKLTTTGSGTVRFNPNLYACGNVCLSLLGTWEGENPTENWDPEYSNLLQLLVSTQAIVMSEDVYYNEPGYEGYAGTPSGITNNEGYSNIVRYNNIRFAMIEQIRNPPKGFEEVVKRHFYIKKEEILAEVKTWVTLADTNEATYDSLIMSHNQAFVTQFQETSTSYKDALISII